jgi:carbohydrate diacid regulator
MVEHVTLTAELAREIAGETSRIVGHNVLITGRDGVVIGSGDTARIGTLHEASLEVMRTLEPTWHSAEQARLLSGVRPGMTLPIMLDGAAVGTVGITGSPRQVRQFGLVVQRQTEILLREAVLLHSKLARERALADLVRDIALYDAGDTDANAIAGRAAELGVDATLPRVVALADVPVAEPVRAVREFFGHPQDVVAEMAAGRICVLAGPPRALDRCERLAATLNTRIGVSDPATGVPALRDAYRDAADALRIGPFVEAGTLVHTAGALRLHQVLAAAGRQTRDRFTELTLGPLRAEPDWPILRETLISWAESGFHLLRAAARLHIHRNTLIYRLDKTAKITGRPTRDSQEALRLYLACLFDQLGQVSAGTVPQPWKSSVAPTQGL